MQRWLTGVAVGLFALGAWHVASAEELAATAPQGGETAWCLDYSEATRQAVQQGKMLFIFFHEEQANRARTAFESLSLTPATLHPRQSRYVWAKVPLSARIQIDGRSVRVLDHAAFAEMKGRQGIAIVDYQNRDNELYGRVVSAFAFDRQSYYGPAKLAIILDLPTGTLTQRTMIFAVRIHPEAPASTYGQSCRELAREAQSHSTHQASLGVQGHHAWDSRFHRINARLPSNLTAQEVVAESWPNEDLVEACIDCVHSWRQSPGHWSAVSGRQRRFGYDIKRGRNGIWYATGIFAR